jgi:hypothetical protein
MDLLGRDALDVKHDRYCTIIKRYRRPFRFCVQNSYPEFLAAMVVEKNLKITSAHCIPKLLVHEDASVAFYRLANGCALCQHGYRRVDLLNPALSEAVRNNRVPVPPHYSLRVPVGAPPEFLKAYTPWQVEERARLAALEAARKARLAARKKHSGRVVATRAKGKGSKKTIAASAKHKGSDVARLDGKPRKRRS